MVRFRFRLLRRYLALWPAEVGKIYRILGMISEGCPGHGPPHLLSASAAEIGFFWDPDILALVGPGLPLLSCLAGPVQHFKAAILEAWRNKVAADLCKRKGFRGGLLLDVHGSLQLLTSSHVRERDKALLRSIMVGGVWNGFLLGRVRSQIVPCRFCGAPDGDGHLCWERTFPPLDEIRENPEFHDLIRMDKAHWLRCLLWHGWLPRLSGINGASPWAAIAADCAGSLIESALGRYSSGLIAAWSPLWILERNLHFPSGPPDVQAALRETRRTEWKKWLNFNAGVILIDEEVRQLTDAGCEIYAMKWVDTDKNACLRWDNDYFLFLQSIIESIGCLRKLRDSGRTSHRFSSW